jgi:hypothetical protein
VRELIKKSSRPDLLLDPNGSLGFIQIKRRPIEHHKGQSVLNNKQLANRVMAIKVHLHYVYNVILTGSRITQSLLLLLHAIPFMPQLKRPPQMIYYSELAPSTRAPYHIARFVDQPRANTIFSFFWRIDNRLSEL